MTLTRKKLLITLAFLLLTAILFWTGSRYPQLNEKAMLGTDTPSMGISFDTVQEIQDKDGWVIKIFYNTINWIETNKKGMTFGLLFGAILMLLFNQLKEKTSENKYVNSLLGAVIGAPMGVCVNCAAPIAKGMKDGGAKSETAIAAMISSPTLNVIVLSILFSILPTYMIALKIISTLVLILIIVPVITRNSETKVDFQPKIKVVPDIYSNNFSQTNNSWFLALKWVVINLFKSLWFVLKTAVPLMLLGGFLGNVLITFLPLEGFVELTRGVTFIEAVGLMLLISAVGTFLPVPMAFDVLITMILWSAGLQANYAMILLFTLGTYSIYSGLIVKKSFSFTLSIKLFFVVAVLGLVNGVIAFYFEKNISNKHRIEHYELLKNSKEKPNGYTVKYNQNHFFNPQTKVEIDSSKKKNNIIYKQNSVVVSRRDFNSKLHQNQKWFDKKEGIDIGLKVPYNFSPMRIHEPLANQRSISTLDIHNDGYPDVLITSANNLFLYANIKGQYFEQQELNIDDSLNVFNSALIDLNNDGYNDIVFSTYLNGNYYLLNNKGKFLFSTLHKLPAPENLALSTALSFGDFNHDGNIDIMTGNWSLGALGAKKYSLIESQNFWLKNNGKEQFEIVLMDALPGETLSLLYSDFIGDTKPDLIVGNDFDVPDMYYKGHENSFKLIKNRSEHIEQSTQTTMSLITADINNDLTPEIYQAQVDRGNKEIRTVEIGNICKVINDSTERIHCENIFDLQKLYITATMSKSFHNCNDSNLLNCVAAELVRSHKTMTLPLKTNEYYPPFWEGFNFITSFKFDSSRIYKNLNQLDDLNEKRVGGIVLSKNENGIYQNETEKYKISTTGWAWNSKFADLDNDEYTDLYIANGYIFKPIQETNILYQNRNGEGFIDITKESGLENYLPSSSYSYVDYDLDGDLDIILATSVGPVYLYENNNHKNNSIAFQLVDLKGHRSAIGAKVFIFYGEGKHQMRELIHGGGYKSFDDQTLYFGLGNYNSISKVIIQWTDGKEDIINEEFSSGGIYKIVRTK